MKKIISLIVFIALSTFGLSSPLDFEIVADDDTVIVDDIVLEIDDDDEPIEPPATLPVGSVALYKAHALSVVREAQVSYQMQYGVEANYDGLNIQGSDVSDVLQKVNTYSFTFDTTNVAEEQVITNLSLMDSEGYSAFYGRSIDKVTIVNGKATFSPKIELRLQYYVPLHVPGIDSLEIRKMNEYGYRHSAYNTSAHDNHVFVPLNLIGAEYEYAVRMEDGQVYVYQNGVIASTTEVVRTNANFKINQYHEVALGLNNAEFVLPLKEVEKPTSPVFKVNATTNNTTIHIDTYLQRKDGSFERPVRVHWFKANDPSKVITVPVGIDGKTRAAFPYTGVYYLSIEFESMENEPNVPDSGKG